MRLINAERLREELLWRNVFLTDNEIDALVDLIDNQPTIFPSNDPLTLDELRAMVGNPVYDCLGQVWYIVESYYDHDLIMTDGTHFNDENKYAKVSKRFYCNRPTIPAAQWIRVEERLPGWSGDYICVSRDKNGREWVIPAAGCDFWPVGRVAKKKIRTFAANRWRHGK